MLKFWKSNHSYVILGKWPSFIRLGQMESGDAVQVYVFRVLMMQAPPATPSTDASAALGPLSSAASGQSSSVKGQHEDYRSTIWMLAVVVCSQVASEEEEMRRRESPKDKESDHCSSRRSNHQRNRSATAARAARAAVISISPSLISAVTSSV